MYLRDINYGRVWGASGVQGFFGEGYWFHNLPLIGANFTGMTFVAKTTTLNKNAGNMPLGYGWQPKELSPKCIVVKPLKGVVLNAVGLSGPGAQALLAAGHWQERRSPFLISFMSLASTAEARTRELSEFVHMLGTFLRTFPPRVLGLQLNFSCPNVGVFPGGADELVDESLAGLDIAAELDIPLVPKYSALFHANAAKRVTEHPACDALCVSNTIPYNTPGFSTIDWPGLFGPGESPLKRRGLKQPGALSGKPLLPILLEWLYQARKAGITKPINAGGGILTKDDAVRVFQSGARSISLGSIAILRPWRVQGIIRRINDQWTMTDLRHGSTGRKQVAGCANS